MQLVSEKVIDRVIDTLEDLEDVHYEKQMEAFAEAQPVIFAWLFSEQFDLLTEDEKGYLQYLSLIIWLAVTETNKGPRPQASEEAIGNAEEKNHELFEEQEAKHFRDKLTAFFDRTDQEDLLAFAEEAVLEEEDEQEALVSKEGRAPIFLALKTLIDVLT